VKNISAQEARAIVREGSRFDDLLFVPDAKFFRRRGPAEIVMQPYDLKGNLMPILSSQYIDYLAKVLPDRYRATDEFRRYSEQLLGGQAMAGRYGW